MSSRVDGVGTPDETPDEAPDEQDTVRRPVTPPATGTPSQTPPPGFIDRAPFGRPAVPDQAPIQSFDRRPRFDSPAQPPAPPAPTPPAPTSTPPPAASRSGSVPGPGSPGPSPTPSPSQPSSQTPRPGSSVPPPTPQGWTPSPQTAPLTTPPSAAPPGIDATRAPRRRRLLVPAIAFGCALLLLLGIGGGLTALWLTGPWDPSPPTADDDPSATGPADASPTAEPGQWQPLTAGQTPAGDADDLRQVLTDNPLLAAQLSEPADCELPDAAGGTVPAEELAPYLQAGADCLAMTWADALEPAGIEFEAPEVVTYTTDSLPADAACEPARFTDAAPVVCHDDNTLYWPSEWDPGFSHTSAEEAPQLYMWHLSYSYTLFVLSAASLDGYYGALQVALAGDQERADGAQRRWALQISCLSSAAVFQLPPGARPDGRVADFVTSTEAQASPATAGEPAPESRATWVRAGRDSDGELADCGTWSAPADEVA